ncbi:uncharacterized protein LOC109717370 isoform X2 [Ananas comosus]|uniref:Uncharacterized protein LOC109717370 isoform X2 n=1 Tax=Ananas comosus TaxID=4615 RepID=A0A6P5FYY1_ANACO|nr:uncharacterized protein LOC109717370 isoform X2 [Ananas comosus]
MERREFGRARQNAMRSGVVVVGAIAFAYLSFRVGFKPYLDRARDAKEEEEEEETSPLVHGEARIPLSQTPITILPEGDDEQGEKGRSQLVGCAVGAFNVE